MQRLVQEGLLHSERNRGLFVKVLDAHDIQDIYAARSAIERAAISMVIARGDPESVIRLQESCDQIKEAVLESDLVEMSAADLRFHEELVSQSGSPRLIRMQKTLLAETRMCLAALRDKYPRPADLVEEHEAVIEAIGAGDEELALDRIEDHMRDALTRLVPATVTVS